MDTPEWVAYHCPTCRRLHVFPEEVVSYLCGKCGTAVSLVEESEQPESDDDDEGEWYGERA